MAMFGKFTQEFAQYILPIYKKHEETFDEAGIHGRMHISRCLIFGEVMSNIYESYGVEIDRFAVRNAIAFHDSGRKGNGADIWELESAGVMIEYLMKVGCTRDYALRLGKFIVKTSLSHDFCCVESEITRAADCLDIMRPCCACTHGLSGFKKSHFHFMDCGKKLSSLLAQESEQIRIRLVRDSWHFINMTENKKPWLSSHPNEGYLEDLIATLYGNKTRWPFMARYI